MVFAVEPLQFDRNFNPTPASLVEADAIASAKPSG
jgi:hypothetical protein